MGAAAWGGKKGAMRLGFVFRVLSSLLGSGFDSIFAAGAGPILSAVSGLRLPR